MKKTLRELAQNHATKVWEKDYWRFMYACQASMQDFIAGYKAAEDKYEPRIKELEVELENWQHNATHGDEGL